MTEEMYDKLKTGDILVIRSGTKVGAAIRAVTGCWANHVAVYTGWNQVVETGCGRKVGLGDARKYLTGKFQVKVYRLRASERMVKEFVKNVRNRIGKPYDFLNIVGLLFLYTLGLEDRVSSPQLNSCTTCSRMVKNAAAEAGIRLTEAGDMNFTPNDLMESSVLNEVR